MLITPETPLTDLSGVGPARAKALANLGLNTVADLLRHYPRGYQMRGDVITVAEAKEQAKAQSPFPVSLELTAVTKPSMHKSARGLAVVAFRACDDTGACEIVFFGAPYLRNSFHPDVSYRFFGRVTMDGGHLKMTAPIWEPLSAAQELPDIVPVYPLAAGLTQKVMATLVARVTDAAALMPETLPEDLREAHSLCTVPEAIRNIHFPPDREALLRARRRILFEQYFSAGLVMSAASGAADEPGERFGNLKINDLLALLPYELTGAQKRSVNEIAADLRSGRRMNRILMGDVGSGKTIVAVIAAYIAAKNGFQTAVMAPTEILAQQHYADFRKLLEPLGIDVRILTGSTRAKERTEILHGLLTAYKPVSVLIGTHALLTEDVEFGRLGLVIEDEQHRFGVNQRAELSRRAGGVHMLVMSATPIPRTLALSLYGGLRVSRLDEMPPGRQTVDTFVVNESYRDRLNGFIRKQVGVGRQVYVVCPAVEDEKEEKEKLPSGPDEMTSDLFRLFEKEALPPLKAAVDHAEELKREFPELSVAYVHGKMRPAEKKAVMDGFAAGEINILVSTTVIEVGVNVPNATLMIVENAERFGLAQLHQLRGRVGRGSAKSYCVLVSEAKGEDAVRRLDTLRRCHDGFAIAEEDLRMRGPGDFLESGGVTRQHGASFASAVGADGDADLMSEAVRAAGELVAADPTLSREDHAMLRESVDRLRAAASATIN